MRAFSGPGGFVLIGLKSNLQVCQMGLRDRRAVGRTFDGNKGMPGAQAHSPQTLITGLSE